MIDHTFRIWCDETVWQVYRDDGFYGDFLTRGDAVRAACFGARSDEGRGHTAQVLAYPGNQPIPHFEPHFGD
jgi:hypothetical protein